MMQPSANGIAALFQGNPGALQQRVQKEQQANPGLPPDLKELMALQILTEKTDAAQRQAAMNQLNQAGGPNMPTVAQTLQERAKQALQARLMQAQQMAQMPPQPQPIPTAPPDRQPEATPEMMQQLAAMQAQGKSGLDQLPTNIGGNYAGGGIIAFATGDAVRMPKSEDESDAERARLERQNVQAPYSVASPRLPASTGTGILTPEQEQQVNQVMLDRLNADPEARRAAKLQRAEQMVGAPVEQQAGLQLLIDELAARRERLAKEQESNKGFDEYMRQIAMTPRGLTSAAAGTYGAEAQRARGKAIEAQDLETLMKMAETKVKLADVKRGWDEKKFTIGEQEFDSVYKEKYDAAKELGASNAAAKKLAQEAVLERERMANALTTARLYTGPQYAASARIDKAMAAYKKANPDATDYEAHMAVTQPGGYLAPDKQQLAELKVLAENLRAMTDPVKNPDLESQKEASRQLALVTEKIAKMSGVELGGASVPPPGAVRLKK